MRAERFGPFRARPFSSPVPWVVPTAIHVVRLRRTIARMFWRGFPGVTMPSALLTPELAPRREQFLLLALGRVCDGGPASAKRINVNSRGRQPTEQRRNKQPDPERVAQCPVVRPLKGRAQFVVCTVGCTHGYSHGSPSANPYPRASTRCFVRPFAFFHVSSFTHAN